MNKQVQTSTNKYKQVSLVLLFYILVLSSTIYIGCKSDEAEKYTIKGRLVESCNNPKPLSNKSILLTYKHSMNKFDELTILTDNNGFFEIEYDKKNLMDDLTIRSNAGFGYKNLITALPKFKNLNVGDLYYENNFFGVVRIISDSSSNSNDTIFYDYSANKFEKSIVGPFKNEMAIDTIIDTYPVIYDEFNNHKIDFLYYWKSNKYTTRQRINTNANAACVKYNFIDIILKTELN